MQWIDVQTRSPWSVRAQRGTWDPPTTSQGREALRIRRNPSDNEYSGRTLIVVFSMHRSGSSLTACILRRLGASLGPFELMGATEHNAHGFYEAMPFFELNRELMQDAFGFVWDVPYESGILKRFLAGEGRWESTDIISNSAWQRGIELVRRLIDSGPVSAFKDPRTVLTWPFWRRVLGSFPGLRVIPLFVLRSPHEVAMSIHRRGYDTNSYPSYHESLDVCDVHFKRMLAIRESWKGPHALVRFAPETLAGDLRQAVELSGLDWSEKVFRETFDPSCKHHERCDLIHPAQRLYDELAGHDNTRGCGRPANLASLDQDAVAREGVARQGILELRDALGNTHKRLNTTQREMEAKQQQLTEAEQLLKQSHQQYQGILGKAELLGEQLQSLRHGFSESERQRYSAIGEAGQLRERLQDLQQAFVQTKQEQQAANVETGQLREELQNVQQEFVQTKKRQQAADVETEQLRERLQNVQQEFVQANSQWQAADAKVESLGRQLLNSRESYNWVERERNRLDRELTAIKSSRWYRWRERIGGLLRWNWDRLRVVRSLAKRVSRMRKVTLPFRAARAVLRILFHPVKTVRRLHDMLVIRRSGLFDARAYLAGNPDVAATKYRYFPLLHFVLQGWRDHRSPSREFNTAHYLKSNADLVQRGINPLVHFLRSGQKECPGRPPGRHDGVENGENPRDSVVLEKATYEPEQFPSIENPAAKLIAFYLPQFHPIPENDQWWGKGFTEWTNVAKAKPQFDGHYQPHRPGELGYYDLRVPEVMERQIELAGQYGIHGFCFYHYWFGGKRLLEKPADMFLKHSEWDFPFCLCWANENWTRRWDGLDREVLIAQSHSPEDDIAFMKDFERYIRDPRYIRIEGKPLIAVYRVDILPDAKATARRWREYCREVGIGEIMLVAAQTFGTTDPRPHGFDAAVAFPPHGIGTSGVGASLAGLAPDFCGKVFHYPSIAHKNPPKPTPYQLFRAVCTSWDNTARRGPAAHIYAHNTPESYAEWLEQVVEFTRKEDAPQHRFVFVNAWNEWAEGAHLEPDAHWGYAYLNATARVLSKCGGTRRRDVTGKDHTEDTELVSVVVPAYNHEQYVAEALESIKHQRLSSAGIEVVVVDDGSTDDTAKKVEEFAAANPDLRLRLLKQENAGAYAAINRGIEESSGAYIAILNSDDRFHPDRIQTLYNTLQESGQDLAFSDFEVIDAASSPVGQHHKHVRHLRKSVDRIESYPSIGYALLTFNSAISTGNLFFARELFDRVGGFSNLAYCHDWDFLLAAMEFTTPARVPEKLYQYRLHETNTFSDLGQEVASKESHFILSKAARRMLGTFSSGAYPSLTEPKKYLVDLFGKLGHAVEPDCNSPGRPAVVKWAAGFCPVCESDTEFTAADSWLRDYYVCGKCGSKPRQRSLFRVLRERFPGWENLKIHESSPSDDGLKKIASAYSSSQYLSDERLGLTIGGWRNENLECLTFEDGAFDLFITQDVLEHVFHPDKAIREMLRVVRPGGALVFTVPVHKHLEKSECCARRNENEVVHLKEPTYHGNPIGDGKSLVTWDYGQDFAELVKQWCSPRTVRVVDVCEEVEQFGIEGEYLNVFVITASAKNDSIAA